MYWLPLITLIPHLLEEYPRFPVWATRHFGATSRAWYVYSHIVLIAVAVPICYWATSSPPKAWARVPGTGFMIALGLNGLFHIVTMLRFREFSPGVITGTFAFLPATGYLLFVTVIDSLLTTTQIGVAGALGAVLQVAAVASLYLRVDIDWRLRRRTLAHIKAPANTPRQSEIRQD